VNHPRPLLRRLSAHGRLLVALGVFAVVFALSAGALPTTLRVAIAWDCGVIVFLALTAWVMHGEMDDMRRTVLANDQGRVAVLSLVIIAVAASFAAILFLLEKPKGAGGPPALQVAFAAATIVCSWLLMHVMFALHYAHRFYRDDPRTAEKDATGGLKFPGTEMPHYWDFAYFSFVIGMTSQVSDVQVTSRAMRRLVLWHGMLSFAFYTVVLALTINIVAGLV